MVRTFLMMCRNFTKLYLDVSLPSIFQDVANSLVAAVFIFITSLVAVSTYSANGTLIGGVSSSYVIHILRRAHQCSVLNCLPSAFI